MTQILSAIAAWVRSAFTDNLRLKGISLVFAVSLFAYLHRDDKTMTQNFDVDLSIVSPPPKERRQLMTQLPPKVRVTLEGSAQALARVSQDGIPTVEIDLSDGKKDRVKLRPRMFRLPFGVEVQMINPDKFDLEWQDVVEQRIPIKPVLSGAPAEGFAVVGEPTTSPPMVRVLGPKVRIDRLPVVPTEPVDVSGARAGTLDRLVRLVKPEVGMRYLDDPEALVSVEVRKLQRTRTFTTKVQVVGVAPGKSTPEEVTVTVVGPRQQVDELNESLIVPVAKVTPAQDEGEGEGKRGSEEVEVTLSLAGDLEWTIQPPRVVVSW